MAATKAMLDQSADDTTQPSRKVLKDDAHMLSYIERVPLGVVVLLFFISFSKETDTSGVAIPDHEMATGAPLS